MAELDRMVPRVVEGDKNSQLFTMAHMIESVPTPVEKVDAIIVMPGLGEHVRLQAAANAWESPNAAAQYLIVAGTNDIEKTQPQPTLAFLQQKPVSLVRTEGVITQVSAEHTRDQTEWIVEQLAETEAKSAALFVTHWHLPRAYSTLVKSLLDRNVNVALFPVAVGTAPDAVVPETGKTVTVMSAGEAERIVKYQELGHVTTLPELAIYLSWLWKQSVVPIEDIYARS